MERESKCGFPTRVGTVLLCHIGFAILYSFRVNMSVALVAMVNATYADARSSAVIDPECNHNQQNATGNHIRDTQEGEFNWDQNQQGLILGSFFYGYLLMQVPGGVLSMKYGGKWVFGLCVLLTALLTLLTPLASRTGITCLIILRFAEGFVEAVSMPSLHALLSKWAPPLERTKLGTLMYSGSATGTVLAMPLSGLLCDYGFAGGWPSVFYVFGLAGVLWFVFWLFLGFSSPEEHPRISADERQYIISSQGPSVQHGPEVMRIPWHEILKSKPVYGIMIAYSSSNWVFYTALTCLPKYFKEVLNFSIKQNGFLSALPFLAGFISVLVAGYVADSLISHGVLGTQNTRKLFTFIALGLPTVVYACLGYLGCTRVDTAVALMTLAVALNGFGMSGFGVNHLDIAPNFAAVLQAVTNTIATIPGCIAPSIVGYFTEDQPTRQQWQKVLFISSGVCAFGALSFLFLGKGTVQGWNDEYEEIRENKSIQQIVDEE